MSKSIQIIADPTKSLLYPVYEPDFIKEIHKKSLRATLRKAYEVEVSFIGDPDYYYFETRKEAEQAAAELNGQKPESASFGEVYTTATINEIELEPGQYIQGCEIITERRGVLC